MLIALVWMANRTGGPKARKRTTVRTRQIEKCDGQRRKKKKLRTLLSRTSYFFRGEVSLIGRLALKNETPKRCASWHFKTAAKGTPMAAHAHCYNKCALYFRSMAFRAILLSIPPFNLCNCTILCIEIMLVPVHRLLPIYYKRFLFNSGHISLWCACITFRYIAHSHRILRCGCWGFVRSLWAKCVFRLFSVVRFRLKVNSSTCDVCQRITRIDFWFSAYPTHQTVRLYVRICSMST